MTGNTQKFRNIFAVLALVYVGLCIIGGFRFYSAVPWLDTWPGYVKFLTNVPNNDWHIWWAPHKEHRIVLSRVFFWIDFAFFKSNGAFLIVLNYLLLSAEVVMLYLCLKERLQNISERVTLQVLALLILALSFSWMQRTNLLWGFQSQFFLAQLLPFLAFYFLHKSYTSTSRSMMWFVLATLAGIISLGAMANCILVLPLLTLMALILRMNWQRITVLALLAGAGVAVYLHHYVKFDIRGTTTHVLFSTPLDALHYVLLFLGNPFYYIARKTSELIPVLAALFLIASMIFFAQQTWRTRTKSSLPLSLLIFMLFICISAVAAAGSRINEGLDQALTARYTTATTMLWLSLLILYAPFIHQKTSESSSRILWCFLLMLLLLLPQQFRALRTVADRNAGFNLSALALSLGIKDTPIIHMVYPYEDRAAMIATTALEKKVSVFAHPPFNDARLRLGQPEQERTDTRCAGALQTLVHIADDKGYYQVRGWLESQNTQQAPTTIRILDAEGSVVGFALSGFIRTDTTQPETFFENHSGFIGYVLAEQANKNIILSGKKPDCELSVVASFASNEPELRAQTFAASTVMTDE